MEKLLALLVSLILIVVLLAIRLGFFAITVYIALVMLQCFHLIPGAFWPLG